MRGNRQRERRIPIAARIALTAALALLPGDGTGSAAAGAAGAVGGRGASENPVAPLARVTVQSYAPPPGLGTAMVGALAQDRHGFLWMGTPEGLLRFDGVERTTFDRRNTPGLASHNVAAIVEAEDGALWLGAGGGGLMRFVDGRVTVVIEEEELPGTEIYALYRSRAGELWVGTTAGLCRAQPLPLTCFSEGDGLPSSWIGNAPAGGATQALSEDADGRIWAVTQKGVAFRDGERFRPVELAAGERPVALHLDRQGRLWTGTDRGRVGWLTPQGFELRFDLAVAEPIPALSVSDSGAIWVATRSRGVARFSAGALEWLDHRAGLPSDQILALLAGAEGELWVGTQRGLSELRQGPITQYGVRHGLTDAQVAGLALADEGVYVTPNEGRIQRLAGDGFASVPFAAAHAPGEVRRVLTGRDGSVWLGTRLGLRRVRAGREEVVPELAGSSVSALFEDRAGRLWVGTVASGLHCFAGGSWRSWSVEEGLPDRRIYTLAEDPGGAIWIGTPRGLGRWDGTTLRRFGPADGLADPLIVALAVDHLGVLWAGGVRAGVARFDGERFHGLGEEAGLPDGTVWAILEDASGALWLSSNRGITRLARSELDNYFSGRASRVRAVRFGPSDGLIDPDCVGGFLGSAVAGRDGTLYFSTASGVAVVRRPTEAVAQLDPPRIEPLRLAIDGRRVPPVGPVIVPPAALRLELDFAAPTFRSPERLRFRHRLLGFEDGWREIGARRELSYTNLPPGRLTLELAASRDGESWSESTALDVLVQPRWHERWRVRLALVAAVLLALGAFLRSRLLRIRRQATALEALVAERTSALALANEQLADRNRKLAELSTSDPLTGLANRRRFDAELDEEWRRALRVRGRLSVLLVDIDHFKTYNDTYGHLAGDEALRRVAATLDAAANRAGEVAARIGGEEFALLLPQVGLDSALALARQIRAQIEKLDLAEPGEGGGDPPRVTVSVGVAGVEVSGATSATELVAEADRALYEAKRGGRNRVVGPPGERG